MEAENQALKAQLALLQAAQALAEKKEGDDKVLLEDTRRHMHELEGKITGLNAKVAAGQLQAAPAPVPALEGYQLLLLTQQQLLLTESGPDDTWGQIVAKYLKKYKPKTDKDKVIQTLDPLRITNPDLIFVVVGWVALIDCDTTGVAVEMLHTKVTSRFQFSHELVDEVGLLLLSLQRTLQVALAGKKPSEKMTGVTELVSVLQARMEWLEKRLADRKRVNEKPQSPPRKAIALKGDHH